VSQSVQSTIYCSDDDAFSSNKIALGVRDLDLIGDRVFGVETGKRGGREEWACRARVLSDNVVGGFNIFPTDAELDWLIERAIGDNIAAYPAGAAEPLETIPGWFVFADKGGVQTFRYDDLRINRLVLSGAETQMMNVRVDVTGSTEQEVSDVTAGATVVDCDSVFHFSDLVLTLDTDYAIKSLELSIDNQIADIYENSITKSIFESQRLMVRLRVQCAYRADTKALYRKAIAGDDDATLVMSDGTNTYTFTFGNVKVPGRGPTIGEVGEVVMPLELQCFRTPTAKAISIAKS
jgi:hypothetical protein